MRHRPSSTPISCMPNNSPHSAFLILSGHLNHPYPTPTVCGFHLGFGLGVIVAVVLLWAAFKLSLRFRPTAWAWFRKVLSKDKSKIKNNGNHDKAERGR